MNIDWVKFEALHQAQADIWRTAWGDETVSDLTFIIQKPEGDEYWIHRWGSAKNAIHEDIAGPFDTLEAAQAAYMVLV